MKRIVLGADHGGYELKNTIKSHLVSLGYDVTDVGTNAPDSCDYPIYANHLCQKIQEGTADLGILVCGTGIGMSMAANKIKVIRAAHVTDTYSARMTKEHNNANIICLGERITGCDLALEIVNAYVEASFQGGRHQTRIDKFMEFENK